jgi:hypothetical protein
MNLKIKIIKLLYLIGLRVSKIKEQYQVLESALKKLLIDLINNNKILVNHRSVRIWSYLLNNFSHFNMHNIMTKITIYASNSIHLVKVHNARNAMFQMNKLINIKYNLIKYLSIYFIKI